MKTATSASNATRATWRREARRVRELRSRCCTEPERFDRITRDIHEPRLRLMREEHDVGLRALRQPDHGPARVSTRYRVRLRGLKLRIIALHNSIRKSGDAGCAMPVWKLAERLKCSTSQYRACMRELREAGVFTVAKFYVDERVVNRHDVRKGNSPRCYTRSRRANVVVFSALGLEMLGVDKLRATPQTNTVVKPEGNDSENLEFVLRQGSGQGVEQRSTTVSVAFGDSLSPTAHQNAAEARSKSFLRAWLAKNNTGLPPEA